MRVSTLVPKEAKPMKPIDIPTVEERIRRRAYELYVQRGRLDGYELDDWLQAEAEVAGKKAKAARA